MVYYLKSFGNKNWSQVWIMEDGFIIERFEAEDSEKAHDLAHTHLRTKLGAVPVQTDYGRTYWKTGEANVE